MRRNPDLKCRPAIRSSSSLELNQEDSQFACKHQQDKSAEACQKVKLVHSLISLSAIKEGKKPPAGTPTWTFPEGWFNF